MGRSICTLCQAINVFGGMGLELSGPIGRKEAVGLEILSHVLQDGPVLCTCHGGGIWQISNYFR